MKLIAREPTPEIITALHTADANHKYGGDWHEEVYTAMYDAAPKIQQEPVAWAATDENGKVEALGFNQSRSRFTTPLYIFPPDAQEEIAKRDERIESLTSAGAEYQRQCFEQAERIKELEEREQVLVRANSSANILNNELASPVLNRVKAEVNVAPPTPEAPGKEDASFEHWYETRFKPAMERGTFDRYVARQAWFASKADAIEKGERK